MPAERSVKTPRRDDGPIAGGNRLHTLPPGLEIEDGAGVWSRSDLLTRSAQMAALLQRRRHQAHAVALLMDNSADWLVADMVCQQLDIPLVPLPAFFSMEQQRHALASAGVGALLTDSPGAAIALGFSGEINIGDGPRLFECAQAPVVRLPPAASKLTYTSGTTGTPKGIALNASAQWRLAESLQQALGAVGLRRHLSLLPLPILLENVAGAYRALATGGRLMVPPVHTLGLAGAAGFEVEACLDACARYQPDSVILLPHMLREWVRAARPDEPRLRSLKFIAVGGARTPPMLIDEAQARGWPVFEGYGLTECCSVVSVNRPLASKPGSVGRPLPGREVRVAPSGRIEVWLGERWLDTGDLGRIDEDGFVYIEGRADHLIVTAYGRNINPEWPESLLVCEAPIAQAVVCGAHQPFLGALIVPVAGASQAQIRASIERVNQGLPDYARIRAWACLEQPLTPQAGLLTSNGRLRREAIFSRYAALIERMFQNQEGDHAVF